MSFQTQINQQPAPGVEGMRASDNPLSAVIGAFVAGTNGARVGGFVWNTGNTAVSAMPITAAASKLPAGFVPNQQEAFITAWKGRSGMFIPAGVPVPEFDRGDFWAVATYADAAVDQKVFANVFNGKVRAANAGAFPTDAGGTSGTITASFATNVMTPTAGSIYLVPGMLITGPGVPAYTYIEAQLTGTTGACTASTYQLTTFPGTVVSSAAIVATSNDGVGGATCASATVSTGTNSLNIIGAIVGSIAIGQLVACGTVGVVAGTYIQSFGTFNGTTGTVILSQNVTATLTTLAFTFSAWIETPWYVKSAGNLGDLIKIGVKN